MAPLLETKLRRPAAPRRRIRRPRLLRKLEQGRRAGRPITLVSAPAGSGKTTCVVEWLEGVDAPVAWLGLDAADDEPGRFYTYLITALQQVAPSVGRDLLGALRSKQLPPADIVCATLVRDLLEASVGAVLVLDDLHVIRDPILLGVLAELTTHLPDGLELVLSTREDPPLPLARLRAHNQLTEIRAADLRFTAVEASQLLNDALDLDLATADVQALTEHTEGWGVGLQLAGLSIREQEDPAAFVAALGGSRRHILQYLTEEVLGRQPASVRRFLLDTSILDALCGELCDAVTGRDDGAEVLASLVRANLFLIPLDDEGRWYRYHHLFADLLRERQAAADDDGGASLHRRACRWYADTGMAEEAVGHALAARDHQTAVALLEDNVLAMFMHWRIKAVQRWTQSLPVEWIQRSPRTNLAFAWMHLVYHDVAAAAPYLQRLTAMLEGDDAGAVDPSTRGQWRAIQVSMLIAQGQADEARALGEEALAEVADDDHLVRAYLLSGIARAHEQLGRYGDAEDAYQRIIDHGAAAGDATSELLGISGLALMGIAQGRLRMVFELATRGARLIGEREEMSPIGAAVLGELGEVHLQRWQLDDAFRFFDRAVEISRLAGFSDADIYRRVVRCRLRLIAGDTAGARAHIDATLSAMREDAPAQVRELVRAQQIHVLVAEGRTAEGAAVLRELDFVPLGDGDPLPLERAAVEHAALCIDLARAAADRDRGALGLAMGRASALVAAAEAVGQGHTANRARLMRARLSAAYGDHEAARADVLRALEDAEPEGAIAAFVEEGAAVAELLRELASSRAVEPALRAHATAALQAFEATVSAADGPGSRPTVVGATEPALIDGLSGRELEVLAEMAKGLKYREIAARLFVSLNTVRSHVKSIYAKLGVDNRTRALEVARQHRLI